MFVLILDREALIKDVDVGQKQGDIEYNVLGELKWYVLIEL